MPRSMSVEKLELAARLFEEQAIQCEPTSNPKNPFWQNLGLAASARLGILEQQPGNEKALLRLYEYVQMVTFEPPALSSVMNAVMSHWSARIRLSPNDVMPMLRMAMATNVARGIKGYPGKKWLRRAFRLDPKHPEVCIEMGIYIRVSRVLWKPWTWMNRQRALKWFKRAISRDPINARAYAHLANCTQDVIERARLMLKCYQFDPENVFARVYVKNYR